jgi:hypothetical protein
VVYRNLPAALAWLSATFGFTEHYRYGKPLSGAQVYVGKAVMMLSAARARAAGAAIFEEIHET